MGLYDPRTVHMYVSSPVSILDQLVDFHDTWYKMYNLCVKSAITVWWIKAKTAVEPPDLGPEVAYGYGFGK